MNRRFNLILILAFVLTGCSSFANKTIEFNNNKKKFQFEYGDQISSSDIRDLIKNKDDLPEKINIKIDGKKLDDSKKYKVGSHKVIISGDGLETGKTKIKIADTTDPIIIQKKSDTGLNSNDDIKTYFKVVDESDVEVSVDSSKLDLSKVGTYPVKVTAKDKYGNEVSEEHKITVHDYDKEKAEQEEATRQAQAQAEEYAKQAQSQAEQYQKEQESKLTSSEQDKAEEDAAMYLATNYDVDVGFGDWSRVYTTKMDGEIEVIIPGSIDGEHHQFIVRLSSLPNHKVGGVIEVLMDGIYI